MSLSKLEATLDEAFNKRAPLHLPPNARKAMAESLWCIALMLGVLQLLLAYWLWHAGHAVDKTPQYFYNTVRPYTAGALPQRGLVYYLAFISLVVVAILLLVASPGLKMRNKSGWNKLFYAVLIQTVAAVLLLFAGNYGGIGRFLDALLTALVGGYLLFQVRDSFTGKS